MYISSLMDSKSEYKSNGPGLFPGRRTHESTFNGLEDFNEEKMVRQQEVELL